MGNGAYYAPDLTKAWLDPAWDAWKAITDADTKEEAMARFLMEPEKFATWERKMPNLGITRDEAEATRRLSEVALIDRHQRIPDPLRPHDGSANRRAAMSRSQRLAIKYLAAAVTFFGVMTVAGLLSAAYYVQPDLLLRAADFNIAKILHIDTLIIWLLMGFMGAIYWFLPEGIRS